MHLILEARRANYYVNNFAGGFTKANKKANTVVIYPNGISKKINEFWFVFDFSKN